MRCYRSNMASPPPTDPSEQTYDRVIIYTAVARGEIVVDFDTQEAVARESAEDHDAEVVAVVREELRRVGLPLSRRPALLAAIGRVRALGRRGVLLAAEPSRLGSQLDQMVICALVEDAGGALVTVSCVTADRADRVRQYETVEALKSFARIRDDLRRRDDAVALRRSSGWPLELEGPQDPEE